MTAEQADFLRGYGATRRAEFLVDGAPVAATPPPFRAQRALARLGPAAKDGGAWARWFERWGFESVLLVPDAGDPDGARGFHEFHDAFLSELLALGDDGRVRDERTLACFAPRTAQPGADLLEQLAHDASGRSFPSEAAALDGGGLNLGPTSALRWQDLPDSPAARALVAASVADNQPQCSACVYRSGCSVPPSVSRRDQGTVWGRLPDSDECALRMRISDRVFGRLDDEKWLLLLDKWRVDMT